MIGLRPKFNLGSLAPSEDNCIEAAAKGVISEAVEIAKNNSLKKEDVPHIIEQISEEIIEIFHRDWT